MKKIKTKFKDLYIFQSKNHLDNRGFFRELIIEKNLKSKLKFFVVSKKYNRYNEIKNIIPNEYTLFKEDENVSVYKVNQL